MKSQHDIRRSSTPSTAPLVPGVPIFGNALALKKEPLNFLIDAAAKYGSVFRLRGPGVNVTVISGPEGRELVQRDGFNGLHRRELFNAFSTEAGVDIFGVQGERHAHLRSLIKLGYSRQIVAQFVPEMEKAICRVVNAWVPGQELQLFDVSSKLSLYSMMAAVTPVDLHDKTDDVIRFGNTVMYVVTKGRTPLAFWSPKYKASRNRVYESLEKAIERHKAGEFSHTPNLYMVDAFLQTKGPTGEAMSTRDIRGGLCYALCGTEIYLGRLVGFMLFELLKNPSLMADVQREVDAAFGGRRRVDAAQFRRMPKLRGTYFETLRAYPLLPGLPFRAEEEMVVRGYRIPKGEIVLVTPLPAHFSAENYTNPHVFDAYRCMPPRNEHLRAGAFAPFGSGKRVCAAAGAVEVLALTVVATVLREVNLELTRPTYRMDLEPAPLISPQELLPFQVKEKRTIDPSRFQRSELAEASDLTPAIEELRTLPQLPEVEAVAFPSGSRIIKEGDEADFFYVVIEGKVTVVKEGKEEAVLVAELGPGRSFGEIGLLKGVRRTASVIAKTDVQLLRVERVRFLTWAADTDLLADELGFMLKKKYVERSFSRAMPGLRPELLAQYASGFRFQAYKKGDVLIRQGDPSETFFVLASGCVEIHKEAFGETKLEAELSTGSFFGEMGILNRLPRNATVRAKTDVEVIALDRKDFLTILRESAKTREDVAVAVCERLLNQIKGTEKPPEL